MPTTHEQQLTVRLGTIENLLLSIKPPLPDSKLGKKLATLREYSQQLGKLRGTLATLKDVQSQDELNIGALKADARPLWEEPQLQQRHTDERGRVLKLIADNNDRRAEIERRWNGSENQWLENETLMAAHLKLRLDLLEIDTLAAEQNAQVKRAEVKKIRTSVTKRLQLLSDIADTQRSLDDACRQAEQMNDLAWETIRELRGRQKEARAAATQLQKELDDASKAEQKSVETAVGTDQEEKGAPKPAPQTADKTKLHPGLVILLVEAEIDPNDPEQVKKYAECFSIEDIELAAEYQAATAAA